MYISLNWLREFVDIEYAPEDIDRILTMLGIEVEKIIDFREKYKNFVTASVDTWEKHPNADKLSVCTVNDGETVRTVVCGAPNVAAGQKVVFAKPGAKVPNGGFIIEKRAVRKIESDGMICSQVELELGDDKSGIWVLPETTEVGIPLAGYLNNNDVIFEISVTPNRADCLSHLGIAREMSAFTGKDITMPYSEVTEKGPDVNNSITVEIIDTLNCPRYTARVVRGAKIGESPEWLKQRLTILGMRPVNSVVDVTNLILLECGQPLHAFDLRELKGNKIIIRKSDEGETFTTLDGKDRNLDASMLLICDAERPVAIGGVMGGENSEIKSDTTDILIESAFFNPSSVRRTSKKLALQSESSYRFERGVDVDNIVYASKRAAKLIAELTGGIVDNGIIDIYPIVIEKKVVNLRFNRVNKVLGLKLTPAQIKILFDALKFGILSENDESIDLIIPNYRVDISMEIDLIEEIARLYDYDNIKPDQSFHVNPDRINRLGNLQLPELRESFREYLVMNGFHEILTQNMMDPKSAEIFTDNPIVIANPLGEELSVMRPSVLPAMLRTIERNNRLQNKNLRLFEFGKIFQKTEDSDTFIEGILESEKLIIAISGNRHPMQWSEKEQQVDFYDMKGIVDNFMNYFKFESIEFEFDMSDEIGFSKNNVILKIDNKFAGHIGEVSDKMLKLFNVENKVYIAILETERLYHAFRKPWMFEKVSQYPSVIRDLAFIFEEKITANEILNEINVSAGKLMQEIVIFDVYKSKDIGDNKKSMAFSLTYSSPDRTLTDEEVESSIQNVITSLNSKFGCELRR